MVAFLCPKCGSQRTSLEAACEKCDWTPTRIRDGVNSDRSDLNKPVEQERQLVQLSLSRLLQFATIAALWCAAGVVREGIAVAVVYTVVTATVTWIVVGRWAVSLPPTVCRRLLAGTMTLILSGSLGVTVLFSSVKHMPLVWLPTVTLVATPWANARSFWGIGGAVVWNVLQLLLVYFVCLAVLRGWDRFTDTTDKSEQRCLAGFCFYGLLMLLAVPLLFSVLSGCYTFSGHGGAHLRIHHLWIHCVLHTGMLLATFVIAAVLRHHTHQSTDPPPNWLKLLTLGYLCLYAALLQVGLFPIYLYTG